MSRIRGEQMYLFMGDEALIPLGATTDCSVAMSAGAIEVSARGAGRWRRFRAGKKTWTVSSGGFYFEQIGTPTSLPQGASLIGTTAKVVISILAKELLQAGINLGNIQPDSQMTLAGDVIITLCRYSGSVGSLATYAIELQGSGDLQQVL